MESYSYQRADVEKLLKEADVFELSTEARVRLECLLHYATHGRNASVTSRRFGISRTTFYSWLTKADLQDPSSLEDRSKAPKHVPQPETNEQTIALIRAYRKERTQLSKEKISALLREEHGIEISASTVGRVIHRFGFYFADTPSHQAKRSAGETQTEDENPQKGGWQKAAVMVIATAGTSLFADVKPAHALQGSVYQLNPAPPDQTVGGELEGTSFILQDAGTTDTAQLLQGSDYQMTAADTASSSAQSSLSSATQSSASSSDTTGGGNTTGGGRRTIPAVQSTSSSSSEKTSVSPTPSIRVLSPTPFPSPGGGEETFEVPPSPSGGRAGDGGKQTTKNIHSPSLMERGVGGEVNSGHGAAQTSHSDQIHADQKSGSLHEAAPRFATIPAQQPTGFAGVLGTTILVTILAGLVGRSWLLQRFTPHAKRSVKTFFVLFAALLLALLWNITSAGAATTVPLTRWYQGHLLNSDGDAVTTAITIRFSEWKSADAEAGDLTATGSINTSAANYVSWQEEHTLTPKSDGSFAVELGSIHALPDLSTLPPAVLQSLYLQVDVKTSGAADSTYDLLDADTGSATIDRTSILSLPFARNADLLDQRDVGSGSGAIPVLSSGSSLSLNGDLTINADAEARDAKLTFGNSILNETLKFSATNSRFEFSHPLWVGGNITATGSLNVLGTMSGAGLQVNGAAVIRDSLELKGNVLLHWNDGKAGINNPPAAGRGSANELSFLTNDGAALTEKMTITSDGKVGIGTTSPTKKLTVEGGDIAVDGNAYFVSNGQQILTNSPTQSNNTLLDSPAGIGFRPGSSGSPLVFFNSSGNVGIGVTAPETKLEVTGTMSGKSLQVTGTGASPLIYTDQTTGNVGIGTATPGTAGLAVMNGNVGIGTTAPANQLEVRSDSSTPEITIPLRLTNYGSEGANYGVGIAFSPYPGDSRYNITGLISVVNDGGAYNPTSMRFSTLAPNSYPAERMRIGGGTLATEGNVGIGTTAPETKLEVVGTMSGKSLQVTGTGAAPLIYTDTTTGKVGIGTTSPGAAFQVGTNINTLPANTGIFVNGANTIRMGAEDGDADYGSYLKSKYDTSTYRGYLILGTRAHASDEDGLTIRNGNVGIGTTSPQSKLHVNVGDIAGSDVDAMVIGSTHAGTGDERRINFTGYDGDGGTAYPIGDIAGAFDSAATNGYLSFATYNAGRNERIRIDKDGNVGIGTTAPETKLEVTGTASGNFIFGQNGLATSGALVIAPKPGTATGNTLIVDTKGLVYDATNKRVGIGTESPNTQLELKQTTPLLRLSDDRVGNWSTGDDFGGIQWYSTDTSDEIASLKVVELDNAGTPYPEFVFSTLGTEKFRIGSLGDISIPTNASTTTHLDIQRTSILSGNTFKELNINLNPLNTNHGYTGYGAYIKSAGNLYTDDHSYGLYSEASGYGINTAGYFSATGGAANYGLIVGAGNVGIGTTTPETKLEVSGTASGQYFFGQQGLATSGALVIAPKPGTGTGNIFIVDTKGLVYDATNKRVGIGTASPGAKLDVVGNSTTGDVGINVTSPTGEDASARKGINVTSTAGASNGTYYAYYADVLNSSQMYGLYIAHGQAYINGALNMNSNPVNNVGNMSLGAVPSSVYGNLGITDGIGANGWGAGQGGFLTFSAFPSDTANSGMYAGIRGIKENSTYLNNQGALAFYTHKTDTGNVVPTTSDLVEQMRITSGGNVGIGTTTPNVKLSVAGTASGKILSFGDRLTGSGAVSIRTLTDSTTAFQVFKSTGTSPVFNIDTSNERVGIGTASPVSALHVYKSSGLIESTIESDDNEVYFILDSGNSTHAKMYFREAGTNIFSIDGEGFNDTLQFKDTNNGVALQLDQNLNAYVPTGLLGVGTTAPETKLEVIGTMSGSNLTLSGKAATNKVLCIKTTGEVGICSSVVDADGGCTCN